MDPGATAALDCRTKDMPAFQHRTLCRLGHRVQEIETERKNKSDHVYTQNSNWRVTDIRSNRQESNAFYKNNIMAG